MLTPEQLSPKEQAKLIALERQYAVADKLSGMTSDELREDILYHMLNMEVSFFRGGLRVYFLRMLTGWINHRLLPSLMWNILIFNPRFNGPCAPTCWNL